jgi:acyl-lipid omega-6 desaturase (Delta-12 desaturase)
MQDCRYFLVKDCYMNDNKLSNEIDNINDELLQSEIRVYLRPSRAKSIWQLCNTLIPYLTLMTLAYFTLRLSFWLTLPVIVLASGFMVRTFIIFHDCGHQSFFSSRKANRFWGVITGFFTFTPYYYWKTNHDRHHNTSGNLDKRGFGDVWTMTVAEFAKASRKERLMYKLYRNPFMMFFLGPLLIILVTHRIPKNNIDKKERNSVYLTNSSIFIFAALMSLLIGPVKYLIIQFITLYIGLVGGVWLFYVQHQFEDVYWARAEEWNFIEASLKGGSFYKLPKIVNWFTGNIGYHHVHHLLTGIPNYNLPNCHEKTPIKKVVKPTKFFVSLRGLRYRLWDENQGKLVGYREVRRYRQEHNLVSP